MTAFQRHMFAADLAACIALEDASKAENAAARSRSQGSKGLVAILAERAAQRGEPGIDWQEYFRNVRIN
jgi:predicted solute-binding protein